MMYQINNFNVTNIIYLHRATCHIIYMTYVTSVNVTLVTSAKYYHNGLK